MKFFHPHMSSRSHPLYSIGADWDRIASRDCYSHYYTVLPDDVVVDVGAGAGWFTCKALDAGAGLVYAVDPDPVAISDIQENVRGDERVIIEPNALGLNTGFSNELKWKEFVAKHNIEKIDFLKVNTASTWYDTILNYQNVEWFRWNVRHMAITVYLTEATVEKFIDWRDGFLMRWIFENPDKLRFFEPHHYFIWNDSYLRNNEWKYAHNGNMILIYLTSW